jgi:hypothetical protein
MHCFSAKGHEIKKTSPYSSMFSFSGVDLLSLRENRVSIDIIPHVYQSYEVVPSTFCFTYNTCVNERFQGLWSIISQTDPEIMGSCIGELGSGIKVKGPKPLQILDDESRRSPHLPDYPDSGEDKDNCKKDDA